MLIYLITITKGIEVIKKTEYQKIVAAGGNKRGRKPLPKAEKAERLAEQREKNRMRAEARRRALIVLSHKYRKEFSELYKNEYEALSDAQLGL